MKQNAKSSKRFSSIQIGAICLLVGLAIIFGFRYFSSDKAENETKSLSPFAKCAAAGNPVTEEYPRQCTDREGRTYREPLQSVPSPYEQIETRRGRVTKLDIEVYTEGVDGVIEIETQPDIKFTYYIGSGGSPDCDRSLIGMAESKEIQVGDLVEVRSKLAGLKPEQGEAVDSIGFQSVCDEGTFIKKLDPTASYGSNETQTDLHSGEGIIEYANVEQGSGAQLVGITGVGNFAVNATTKIYDENNKEAAFSYLRKGQKVRVSGAPGEGYLKALDIKVLN